MYGVGVGPGDPELMTVKAVKTLQNVQWIAVPDTGGDKSALSIATPYIEGKPLIYCPAPMTRDSETLRKAHEEGIRRIAEKLEQGENVAFITLGDPSVYSTYMYLHRLIREAGYEARMIPGVPSFCAAAAAALRAEYTLPGVSQTVILTRLEGRTPVPERERMVSLASHGASMAVFLSAGMVEELSRQLQEGGYSPETPAAIVYKASWPDEKTVRTTVGGLPKAAKEAGIQKTALILVGGFLGDSYERSKLYDPQFSHEFRAGKAD